MIGYESGGNPYADSTSSDSGSSFNWGNLADSAVTGGTNVLTQVLKNQGLSAQANAAAKSSAATTQIIIIAVIVLVLGGVLLVFLNRGKK